jgi:hypothetical protein
MPLDPRTRLPTFIVFIAEKPSVGGRFAGISRAGPAASQPAVFAGINESATKQQGKDQPDHSHGADSSIGP